MTALDLTLNDLAVIRTTFETIDVFPDDGELRAVLMEIITEARENLVHRLRELRAGAGNDPAFGSPEQLQRFKEHLLRMISIGADRRELDRMMRVRLFVPVGEAEATRTGAPYDPKFRYEMQPELSIPLLRRLSPRLFIGQVIEDLLCAATDEASYTDGRRFEMQVYQKAMVLLFVSYEAMIPRFDGPDRYQ